MIARLERPTELRTIWFDGRCLANGQENFLRMALIAQNEWLEATVKNPVALAHFHSVF